MTDMMNSSSMQQPANGNGNGNGNGSAPAPASPLVDLDPANIEMLMDVPLIVSVELGRTRMTLRQALELADGSVVELERLAGDPVDVYVNERLIARGEVVVVDDKFAVRVTELVNKKSTRRGI